MLAVRVTVGILAIAVLSLLLIIRMRVSMVSWSSVLAATAQGASIPKHQTSNLEGPLRFNADGSFHISVLQDLHFGESKSFLPQTSPH
jgi:hypothetical protein